MFEQIKTHTVDRSKWPAGPWDDELEDRLDFQHSGFACMMLRTPNGHWCGYVGVPESHPAFGKDLSTYDDESGINLSVHGGITYASLCEGVICHVPAPGYPDKVWWLGFDCCHAGDSYPNRFTRAVEYGTYRTRDYVIGECKSLAEQLACLR